MKVAPDLARAADAAKARGGRLGSPLSVVDETVSTNDDAKQGARDGASHGAVWVAEAQTKGRGRKGRTWFGERYESLLFSVLLRIPCQPQRVPLVSLVCGLAVRDAVARAIGDDDAALVKWPNDVFVRRDGKRRKISGILVESSMRGSRVDHIVVGVGVNVHARSFASELGDEATSLALERRSAIGELDRAEVLADVLAGLDRDVEHVLHRGLGLVRARLARHDMLRGEVVESDDGELRGVAEGIDADGKLIVRKADGISVHVGSGEMKLAVAESTGVR